MNHIHERIEGWFNFPNLYSWMVKTYPSGSHFVEIGSWMGKSSAYMAVEIANSQKYIKFDCIDTWKGSEEHQEQADVVNDQLYQKFLDNTAEVSYYIRPVRMSSLEAARLYKDGSLDFIFIDAAHDYENVKADITAWFPKLKPQGHIAGHDYSDTWPGVKQAVDEYFAGKNVIKSEGCWCYFND